MAAGMAWRKAAATKISIIERQKNIS